MLAVIGESDINNAIKVTHSPDSEIVKKEKCKCEEKDTEVPLFDCVNDIYGKINEVIDFYVNNGEHAHIKNMGLDMETVWPRLIVNILNNQSWKNIKFEGLLINPDSEIINQHCDIYISPDTARQVKKKFNGARRKHSESLATKNNSLEIKEFSRLPILHGFLINDTHLFYSLTAFEDDELTGGFGTYMYIDKHNSDKGTAFFIDAYNSWFSFMYDSECISDVDLVTP